MLNLFPDWRLCLYLQRVFVAEPSKFPYKRRLCKVPVKIPEVWVWFLGPCHPSIIHSDGNEEYKLVTTHSPFQHSFTPKTNHSANQPSNQPTNQPAICVTYLDNRMMRSKQFLTNVIESHVIKDTVAAENVLFLMALYMSFVVAARCLGSFCNIELRVMSSTNRFMIFNITIVIIVYTDFYCQNAIFLS